MDNCDCCFLEALVSEQPYGLNLRPHFIHVEFHPMIPPPILYRPLRFTFGVGDSLLEISSRHGRRGHFLHCSLSAFSELLVPLGYRLVHVLWNDAVFVHQLQEAHPEELQKRDSDPEELWFGAYFCHPLRPSPVETHYMGEFQYDYRRWSDIGISETDRLESIRRYLDFWQIPRAFYTLYLSLQTSSNGAKKRWETAALFWLLWTCFPPTAGDISNKHSHGRSIVCIRLFQTLTGRNSRLLGRLSKDT